MHCKTVVFLSSSCWMRLDARQTQCFSQKIRIVATHWVLTVESSCSPRWIVNFCCRWVLRWSERTVCFLSDKLLKSSIDHWMSHNTRWLQPCCFLPFLQRGEWPTPAIWPDSRSWTHDHLETQKSTYAHVWHHNSDEVRTKFCRTSATRLSRKETTGLLYCRKSLWVLNALWFFAAFWNNCCHDINAMFIGSWK